MKIMKFSFRVTIIDIQCAGDELELARAALEDFDASARDLPINHGDEEATSDATLAFLRSNLVNTNFVRSPIINSCNTGLQKFVATHTVIHFTCSHDITQT